MDPEHDTPEVLAQYAARYHAQPDRWRFLTGSREDLNHLARDAFKLSNVDGSMTHSTRLVLLDRQSRIRGYYGTDQDDPVQRLVLDIKRVLARNLMISIHDLPAVNATLNGTAAVLLSVGLYPDPPQKHRGASRGDDCGLRCVVRLPLLLSGLPLQRRLGSLPAKREPIRTVYLSILATHTALAAAVPPLAIITLSRGLRSRFDRHRKIARWAFPVWMYVSVTGVVVYWMLYQM